jgi:hypothetical protein
MIDVLPEISRSVFAPESVLTQSNIYETFISLSLGRAPLCGKALGLTLIHSKGTKNSKDEHSSLF